MQANQAYHRTQEWISQEEKEIKRAVNDRARFNVLYDRYFTSIYRYVYNRVKSEDVAADVTSQVFLKAMMNLDKYQFRGLPFSSWLFTIGRNELNKHFNEAKAERVVSVPTESLGDIIDEMDSGNNDDRRQKLIKALDQLSEEEVELIELKYFEKRPHQEIAELFGWSESNAKVKVHRIVQKLKKLV